MSKLIFDFTDKTVFITAGTKGIGLELTNQFLLSGANVAVCSSKKESIKKVKIRFNKFIKSRKLFCIQQDLTKTTNHKNLVKKINDFFRDQINILINNSGGPPFMSIEKSSKKNWENAINMNLMSAIYFSKAVIPSMKKNKWGRIINLTSLTAKEPAENMVLSNVTRSGLASFSKTLSLEISRYGITVNNILTGGCLTDRLKDLIKKSYKNGNFKNQLRKLSNNVPVRRIAETEEFIKTILFLATEDASYVNGVSIPVDGGLSKSIF